jgi:hypothetical protein
MIISLTRQTTSSLVEMPQSHVEERTFQSAFRTNFTFLT